MNSDFSTPPQQIQRDVFPASGTWTKPSWAKRVRAGVVGGGGAGGSGARRAAGGARSGGIGGFGSILVEQVFAASELTDTVAVTIGAAATGGAPVAANDTNGNPGANGVDATFGAYVRGKGAQGGPGGVATNTTNTIADGDIAGQIVSLSSSVTAALSISVLGATSKGGCPGGTAGSLTAGNLEVVGQHGGYPVGDPAAIAGARGASDGAPGTNGTSPTLPFISGTGGGGGAANLDGAGGDGGDGGIGCGGGGGGASVNNFVSGGGGDGGLGYCWVESYRY